MKNIMRNNNTNRYRKFQRGSVYYIHDAETGKQRSLQTKNKRDAIRLIDDLNQPYATAGFHLQMARTHLQLSDAEKIQRTWQEVMDYVVAQKNGKTQVRWARAVKDKALDPMVALALSTSPEP